MSLDENSIKIGDFGLVVKMEEQEEANSAESSAGLKNSGKSKQHNNNDGTYLYMSPEQVLLC